VGQAIQTARPWAVDVSSGVERDRVKDPTLIRAFISEVRRVNHDRG
jgi:phosphoribosylanthranilate isomerase